MLNLKDVFTLFNVWLQMNNSTALIEKQYEQKDNEKVLIPHFSINSCRKNRIEVNIKIMNPKLSEEN